MLIPNSSAPIQKKKERDNLSGGGNSWECKNRRPEREEEKRRSFDGAISLKTFSLKKKFFTARSRCAFPAAPAAPVGRW